MAFKQNVAMSVADVPRDPHQMLLYEMQRADREDAVKLDLIGGRPVDQRVGASDQYLVLDSSEKNEFLSNIKKGVFSFDIKSAAGTGDGIIGVHDELHTISEIEFQSFPLPDIAIRFTENSADEDTFKTSFLGADPCREYLTIEQALYKDIIYENLPLIVDNPNLTISQIEPKFETAQNRFEIQVSETSLQSYSDKCGFRHNFAFDVIGGGGPGKITYASPVSPVYVFTDPINNINTFNLTFFDAYRCVPLSFLPDLICDTRIGVTMFKPADPSNGAPPKYSIKLYFSAEIPPFLVNDSVYISPFDKKVKCKQRITPTCFDTRVYDYITSCGINSPASTDYPLVSDGVDPVIIGSALSGTESLFNSITSHRYWESDVAPYIEYPVFTTSLYENRPAMTPPPPIVTDTNNILVSNDPAVASQYGFDNLDSLREIIVFNNPANDSDTKEIITCVSCTGFLLKFADLPHSKVRINTCKVAINMIEDKLRDAKSKADTIPLDVAVPYLGGYYMVKNFPKDIHLANSYSDPTLPYYGYNTIRMISAKPLVGTNPTNVISSNAATTSGPLENLENEMRRLNLLPNIDEVCLCVPKNQLRIPIRVRRILRRITQLSGI